MKKSGKIEMLAEMVLSDAVTSTDPRTTLAPR